MSSEESAVEDTASENNSSDDSDGPSAPARKKQKLVKHKLPWRSQECQSVIEYISACDVQVEYRYIIFKNFTLNFCF